MNNGNISFADMNKTLRLIIASQRQGQREMKAFREEMSERSRKDKEELREEMSERSRQAAAEMKAFREEMSERSRKDKEEMSERSRQAAAEMKDIREQQRKTDEQQRKTDEQLRKTDEQVDKLNRAMGRFFSGWGEFVEALVAPAMPKMFAPLGFRIDNTETRCGARQDSRAMEVDIISSGVWNGGSPVIIAVSVKSHLETRDVRCHVADLGQFFDFFPRYAGRTLFGAVAGIRLDKNVTAFSRDQGLHLIGSSGDAVELLSTRDFKPRVWKG